MMALIMFSCQPIDQKAGLKGELISVYLENLKGIPAEYGTLISVTTHGMYEGYAQLWFVDDESTIRMVRVQFHENCVVEGVLVIPRY